ncbi:mercuric reductase [Candidatus Entotheonella serta]|nr:mercuric reductase [Candidatus Entotheonella serta]
MQEDVALETATAVAMLPEDEHNERLLSYTHPSDWRNPDPQNPYNLVVIGGGTAGLVAAMGAAGLGARVALIEKHLMGGDCLNYGCVPSKGLIRAATAWSDVREAEQYGIEVRGEVEVDFGSVMARMRRLRADISKNDSVQRFTDAGIDVFLGTGQFTGPRSIDVDGKTLRFAKALIATGARAAVPPIPGIAEAGYYTNETIFSLTERPSRVGVIGGGPIGCELAQTFQRLGAQVTLFDIIDHILIKEDADAAAIVHRALLRDGVQTALGVQLQGVQSKDGEHMLTYTAADGQTATTVVDAILVAAGRAPNIQGLGLEEAGVTYDPRTGVQVDDRLRTTNPHIYAAGDICSRYQFTHAADFLARTVIANALFKGRQKASALTIPWCTYTEPQIAHVGITLHQAAADGIAVDTFTQQLEDVDRAVLDGATEGFARVHVKKGTDRILGATIIARNAGDMIGMYTTAMTHGLGLGALSKVILPYPTQAEAVHKTGDLYNRTRLTPRVKKIFGTWLKWQRGR